MTRLVCIIFMALTYLMLFNVLPVFGQDEQKPKEWTGSLRDGTIITESMLVNIINEHEKWLKTDKEEGEPANLSKADLSHAILRGADLRRADLSEAILRKADLSGAKLNGANLRYANLLAANLSKANLFEADLSNASLIAATIFRANLGLALLNRAALIGANMHGVNLSDAKLRNADLSNANLRDAVLRETDIGNATFLASNVSGAKFDIKPNSLPYLPFFVSVRGLSKLSYNQSPLALVELRKAFKEAGFRTQEREVTHAIKHAQRLKLWNDENSSILNKIESMFNLTFFEWTCAYGMSPGRCFLILIGFIFVFTIPYKVALSYDSEDGIWIVWIADRVRKDLGRKEPVRLHGSGWSTLKWGFYFSILSAFSIGWRELNIGNWISRMQRREYNLRATGWVRTISGIQSLTSVYLLALWVLTYFGRPFEAA